MFNDITEDTLSKIRQSHSNPDDLLTKSITTQTGLVAYDLQAPAKNLYPIFTPLRNSMPRVGGGTGTATNWRVVSNLIGSGISNMGWVPEGARSGTMSYQTANKAASYVALGEEDSITYEARNAAKDFENLRATATMRLLQKMMVKEEMAILGGNASLALGTPSAPSLLASGTGATIPADTYSVRVVALTVEGKGNATVATGVVTTKTIISAGGVDSYTLSGGSSNISANATIAVTLGQSIHATVPVVNGAVGYAWYAGDAGSETLQAITTINSVVFSIPFNATTQAASAITSDNSRNPNYGYDGLLTTAFNNIGSSYVKTLATGVAGVGTTLTSSGRGSVAEIDAMLQAMWDNAMVSPTVIYVNSQELTNISNKVLNAGSSPLLRYNQSAQGGDAFGIVASGVIEAYYNPYAANGGIKIPIKIHPNVPAGTILAYAEQLPMTYQSNETPNVAEMRTRQDYYQIDWPITSRREFFGVYAEEVLAVYAPFSMGVITNIANG